MLRLDADGWPDIDAMTPAEFLDYSEWFADAVKRKLADDEHPLLLTTDERARLEAALTDLNFRHEMCRLEIELQ